MKPPTRRICQVVAEVFGITQGQLLSRERTFAFARHVAISLAWDYHPAWGPSVADRLIAKEFRCSHYTVRYARASVSERKQFGNAVELNRILSCEEALRRLE